MCKAAKPRIGADIPSYCSAPLQPRTSRMLATSLRPMACPSTLNSLDAPLLLHVSRSQTSRWSINFRKMSSQR